jgi:uncharacterized protein
VTTELRAPESAVSGALRAVLVICDQRYAGCVTTFDLRRLKLRPGEQHSTRVEIALEPLALGGQTYAPAQSPVEADLRVTKTNTGTVLELDADVRVEGPCFRCLEETFVDVQIALREYNAVDAEATPDERSEYVDDDEVDLSAWVQDAVALALPDKILCRPDCAGLCPVCGKNLNEEPHQHEEAESDPRWAALEQLRERT